MANDLDKVIPQLLAQGLLALRNRVTMPRLVNRSYEREAAQKGATIDVPIPSLVVANDVVPGPTPQAGTDASPTSAPIQLNNWKEAGFTLSDKEIAEVMMGTIPMQASEAVSAIADVVNLSVLEQYHGVYGRAGVAGTTPFAADASEATAARKVLNVQKCPLNPRFLVLDPDAEESALNLTGFQDASFAGTTAGIIDGTIGRKLGFDWVMDQQVVTHIAGSLTAAVTVSGVHAVGATVITLATDGTGAVALNAGDLISIAGDSQEYAVLADAAVGASSTVQVQISPSLQVATAGGEAVTLAEVNDHVVNLAFHRDAFALATRPLAADANGLGSRIMSQVDPVSGLALRLEVQRQWKQTRWSFDMLWGTALVRPELAARLLG